MGHSLAPTVCTVTLRIDTHARSSRRKLRFNIEAAAIVVWTMFAAVVCYAIGVWLAIAVMEHDNAFAAFSGNVYWFAAALSLVIACAIGFVAIVVTQPLRGWVRSRCIERQPIRIRCRRNRAKRRVRGVILPRRTPLIWPCQPTSRCIVTSR